MDVPGRGCRVPSQDNAIRTNGTCTPRTPELADLRAPCGTASRNFYYSCCFRTLRGSRPNPGGVSGKFPGLGRDQPGRYSRIRGSLRRDATRG